MEPIVNELPVVNGYEIFMKELAPTKWYVGGILQEGANLLSGDPKVGKSFLALQIAVAVAGEATTVCGSLPVGIHGRVLYLALDDGSEKRLQNRLRLLAEDEKATKNLDFVYDRRLPSLKSGLESLLDRCLGKTGYELVVLDTYGAVLDSGAGKSIYRTDYSEAIELQKIAQKHNICLLVIHHTNKGDSDDPVKRASSSHGLTGAVDSVLMLSHANKKQFGRLVARPRDGEESEINLRREENGGWVVTDQVLTPPTAELTEERRQIKEILILSPKSRDEVAAVLDISSEAARKRLERMQTVKMIGKMSDGRFEWIG